MGTIVSAELLQSRLGEPNLVILDCRFSLADPAAGHRQFEESHIPGARYIDLERDMSGPIIPGKTGRHPLPTADAFADTLGRLGISNQSSVVAYDESSGAFAARAWWMLRWLGHDDVAVLDGGFKHWLQPRDPSAAVGMTEVRFGVEQRVSPVTPTLFTPGKPLTRIVEAEQLHNANHTLLDARDGARFRGEVEPIDPVAGHIPGALCATFNENLTPEFLFKPASAIRERFVALGVTNDTPVVSYCGSGVTAAHNILALVYAGFPEPALYPGSFSEWITDPKRPVATG